MTKLRVQCVAAPPGPFMWILEGRSRPPQRRPIMVKQDRTLANRYVQGAHTGGLICAAVDMKHPNDGMHAVRRVRNF